MALQCGIVGLPNVGKSTLFNCLSNAKAQAANFPFCTIEPNIGVITVPDTRLTKLAELVKPLKVQPNTIEIVDIAGLVKGASKGEGLGNQFLGNIRATNAIIHVLRCFDDDNVIHVDGSVDPIRDKEIIDTELQLKDLDAVSKRIQKVEKMAKTGNDQDAKKWLKNSEPLLVLIEENHLKYWNATPSVKISGSHDSPAMGISFALDYSRSFKNKKLEKTLLAAAKKYYLTIENAPILSEPVEYDFMSGTLLIADLMRKVLSGKEYAAWLSKFTPELVDEKRAHLALKINKTEVHDGYESHWDGFHLNRIWCLNGMLISLPKKSVSPSLKGKWTNAMNEMWDYAQLSIGKGNYDIDHWLSSFSVFALEGYK
jgi:hypothetical protein